MIYIYIYLIDQLEEREKDGDDEALIQGPGGEPCNITVVAAGAANNISTKTPSANAANLLHL